MKIQAHTIVSEEKERYYWLQSKSWITLQRCCCSWQHLPLGLTMDLDLVCYSVVRLALMLQSQINLKLFCTCRRMTFAMQSWASFSQGVSCIYKGKKPKEAFNGQAAVLGSNQHGCLEKEMYNNPPWLIQKTESKDLSKGRWKQPEHTFSNHIYLAMLSVYLTWRSCGQVITKLKIFRTFILNRVKNWIFSVLHLWGKSKLLFPGWCSH